MIYSERSLYILNRINELGVVNIKDISIELETSETTVRRDFEKLEKSGKLKRVQGGAMKNEANIEGAQLAMKEKRFLHYYEKKMVGQKAANEVKDGDSVFVDCGTSLVPLAEALLKKKIQIVTNNMLIANSIKNPVAEVFFIGGKYNMHYNMTYGPMAKESLKSFKFTHAFIGCFSFSIEQSKAYALEMDSTEVKQAAMKNAQNSYLLVDESKAYSSGFYAFTELDKFKYVFCDKEISNKKTPKNFIFTQ